MKSTNNPQTTEDMNQKAIALTEPDCIVEELSDEAASAVSGGGYPNNTVNSREEFWKAIFQAMGTGAGIG